MHACIHAYIHTYIHAYKKRGKPDGVAPTQRSCPSTASFVHPENETGKEYAVCGAIFQGLPKWLSWQVPENPLAC